MQDIGHAAEADRVCCNLLQTLPGGTLGFRHQRQQCLHGRGWDPSGLSAGQRNDETSFLFYEKKEILYFEGRKKADSVLPESAEKLEGQISRLKAGKDRKKAEELWTQVLADCQDRYTDGRLLVQWLKKLNQTAGIEKEPIWYGDIESFEKFREKGSACISQLFVGEEDAVPEGISAAVKKALEFIREHYEAPISLQDAADAAEVNPAYLSYLFKQEMKIGFSNYVQELRIDCAKKLLSETNCKVKDVALRSGFGDYHYFSKTFKKFTGLSPAEYRKESGLS